MKTNFIYFLPPFFFPLKKGPDQIQALKFCLFLADKWLKNTTAKVMANFLQSSCCILRYLLALCLLVFWAMIYKMCHNQPGYGKYFLLRSHLRCHSPKELSLSFNILLCS